MNIFLAEDQITSGTRIDANYADQQEQEHYTNT